MIQLLGFEILYVVQCLGLHFLFSSIVGYLGALWMWTTFSKGSRGRHIRMLCLLWALFLSSITHLMLDTFTNWC